MLLRIAALVTLATSIFFLQRAANPIFEQNARVRQWPAVDVAVDVTSPTADPRGKAGPADDGRFKVVYRHEVGGNVYRTFAADPRAADWMPAGPTPATDGNGSYVRRAHYDPERPGQLFFPKSFAFRDYLPIFVWGPALALGFGGLVLRRPGRAAASPVGRAAAKGWYRVRPKYSMRYRASGAWGMAIVCNLALAAAAYDYFTGEPRTRTMPGVVLVSLAMLPGVVTSGLAIYYSWMLRRVGEPTVSLDALRVPPDGRLAVKVELPLKRDLDLEHVRVSLICIRTALENAGAGPRWRERTVYEDRAERSVGRRATEGTRVAFEQRFRVPGDAEPSSLSHAGIRGPWIDWYVELQFHLDDGPDYRGRFPVTVGPA
jgi:hypothetical protein